MTILVFIRLIYKMLARSSDSEGPDQTAKELGLHCLPRPFFFFRINVYIFLHVVKKIRFK